MSFDRIAQDRYPENHNKQVSKAAVSSLMPRDLRHRDQEIKEGNEGKAQKREVSTPPCTRV
jgi:hypothetical protein